MIRSLVVGSLSTALLSSTALAMPSFTFTGEVPVRGDVTLFAASLDDPSLQDLDQQTGNRLVAALTSARFRGTFGEAVHLHAMAPFDTITVVGLGEEALTPRLLTELGGHVAASDDMDGDTTIMAAGLNADGVDSPAAWIAKGYALRAYSFDTYKSASDDPFVADTNPVIVSVDAASARARYSGDLAHVVEGVYLTRDLGSEPGNAVYPQEFVDRVRAAFQGVANVRFEVLDAAAIRRERMGALMGVGQGSIHDPRLLVVRYTGGERAPLALVGKGVTFDTGGISLKPNENMWYMKADMSGAAAVAGTVLAAARRAENINLVGVMPLAENMPSQDAIRPGDVLTTRQGTTIEIMSTDAEGRLLLADAVRYAQDKYNPAMLVNIATLTGSALRATGDEYAALVTREMDTSLEMMEVGKRAGEDVWPLPLHPNHFDQIKSDIADIKNTGGNPGASIGAAVVGTFIDEDLPWVHLDIAGVEWSDKGTATAPKGHTGWGVRFMDQLVREFDSLVE